MTAYPLPVIIEASQTQPLWSRIRDVMLTIVMWCLYLYLMQDFFTFIVTIFDWSVLGIERPDLPKAFKILKTMKSYLGVIVINGTLLLGWAIYNQLRFRGTDRRKAPPQIDAEDLGKLYHVPANEVIGWQQSRIITLYHDARGDILRVEIS